MEYDVAAIAGSWAAGWAVSRNTAAPVDRPYGWVIDLGPPDHPQRHVIVHGDATVLRALDGATRTPGACLKVCAPAVDVVPHLGSHWQIQPPEYLMTVTLNEGTESVHDGYELAITGLGDITEAEYRNNQGELAARGRVARSGEFAIFDQIVTEPGHQRKGLGRSIMTVLGNASLAQGASTGVLVATEQGRAL